MSKYKFERYEDPFRAFNIQMSIICDLEQGGKIDENEAFEQVKALYKQFKHYLVILIQYTAAMLTIYNQPRS